MNDVPGHRRAYTDPVAGLLTLGEAPSHNADQWMDYRSRFGLTDEHTAELIRMACDQTLNRSPADASEVWAPVHAWRSLGQLQAQAAIDPLADLIATLDDEDDMPVSDLPAVFGMIGPAALPRLLTILNDKSAPEASTTIAIAGLGTLGAGHSACREACVASLVRVLNRHLGVKAFVNGLAVWALIDLAAVEAIDAIRMAFRRKVVDVSIAGDIEEVEINLGLRSARSTPPPRSWISQHRTSAPEEVGRNDPCPCGSGKKYKRCCLNQVSVPWAET